MPDKLSFLTHPLFSFVYIIGNDTSSPHADVYINPPDDIGAEELAALEADGWELENHRESWTGNRSFPLDRESADELIRRADDPADKLSGMVDMG